MALHISCDICDELRKRSFSTLKMELCKLWVVPYSSMLFLCKDIFCDSFKLSMLAKKYCSDFQIKVFSTIYVSPRLLMFPLVLTNRADPF